MEIIDDEFSKKKKLLMQINSGELNKSILYYINEARTSPKDFSRHLMVDDDVDEKISKLSLFFKYSSTPVPPLELDQNLETSSNDLLYHIISSDNGSSELEFSQKEKVRNSLKERLKKLNLIPVYHCDLLIIGVDNAIDALANILINNNHRNKILSPDMKYIGIASGFLPSERLCVVIDIVNSFRIYNNYLRTKDINYINSINDTRSSKYNYIRFTNVGSDDECEDDNDDYAYNDNSGDEEYRKITKNTYNNKNYFNTKYNTDKKKIQNIRYFNSFGGYRPFIDMKKKLNFDENKDNLTNDKKEKIINLRISGQKWFSPSNRKINKSRNKFYDETPKRYKFPVSVSVEKKYAKNKYGDIFPVYHRKTLYDDGSILLQPYINE